MTKLVKSMKTIKISLKIVHFQKSNPRFEVCSAKNHRNSKMRAKISNMKNGRKKKLIFPLT